MTCKHLNARIDGSYPIGKLPCPDCGEAVHISTVLNNWLGEMEEAIEKVEETIKKIEKELNKK